MTSLERDSGVVWNGQSFRGRVEFSPWDISEASMRVHHFFCETLSSYINVGDVIMATNSPFMIIE